MDKWSVYVFYFFLIGFCFSTTSSLPKRSLYDRSIGQYQNQRTCWWNEICKKEFRANFECRCPRWSYCRGPGRYYDALCSVTATGYVWMQDNTHE